MSRTHVPAEVRRVVLERAGGRCEYCLYPQAFALLAFEVEHIVAEKHGGATAADNLALACAYCNRFKGSDPGSFDPETGQLVRSTTRDSSNGQTIFDLKVRGLCR